MKFLIISTLSICLSLFTACDKQEEQSVEITIKNISSEPLHELKIYASYGISNESTFSDSLFYTGNIASGDSVILNWHNPKLNASDGGFYIKTTNLGCSFGYFTNGHILKELSKYKLNVYNDSIR